MGWECGGRREQHAEVFKPVCGERVGSVHAVAGSEREGWGSNEDGVHPHKNLWVMVMSGFYFVLRGAVRGWEPRMQAT